jgi:hypothetical protein
VRQRSPFNGQRDRLELTRVNKPDQLINQLISLSIITNILPAGSPPSHLLWSLAGSPPRPGPPLLLRSSRRAGAGWLGREGEQFVPAAAGFRSDSGISFRPAGNPSTGQSILASAVPGSGDSGGVRARGEARFSGAAILDLG